MNPWEGCKKILCIRPDNMGDVLMSSPAILALKQSFNCHLTLLTSSMGKVIAPYIPGVDEMIVWDAPWVKSLTQTSEGEYFRLLETLKAKQFDGAIIFTVFSQNPLPAALLATLAGIPRRVAYCRENPYQLLTDWLPEEEPYTFIRHQVRRDIDLVRSIGACVLQDRITLQFDGGHENDLKAKLLHAGVDLQKPWLIMHAGASEKKRQYPSQLWIEAGRSITSGLNHQIILTGSKKENMLAESIRRGIGEHSYNVAGTLSIEELITLIRLAPLLISVNTGTVHIAAALQTSVVVLYALTNPQHAPWKSKGVVLPFTVPEKLQSRNEILKFVCRKYFSGPFLSVSPEEIYRAAHEILVSKKQPAIPELIYTSPSNVSQGMRSALNFQEP